MELIDERLMYDIIANEVEDWKRFARLICIKNSTIERFDRDYPKVYEKAYQCIMDKIESSENKIEWSFWKGNLLRMDEGEIVDTIEKTFPYLTVTSKSVKEVHMCFDKKDLLATIAHNANRKENYLLFKYNLKSYIEYYKGTGALTRSVIEDLEEFKGKIFQKHMSLLDCKILSFSNKERVECKVIENCDNLLQDDDGFVIRGYDAKKHLQFSADNFNDETPYKDSYVLLCLVKHNTVILIDTNPTDINKALTNNRTYIRYLRKLHPCLNGRAILFLSVVLWEEKTICGSCEELELIVSKMEFEDPTFLKRWLEGTKERISEEEEAFEDLFSQSNSNDDVSNPLKKGIMEFVLGVTSFNSPFSTNNLRYAMDEENTQINLTMVYPEKPNEILL